MTVLVTGATGFIGSHLVPALLARGEAVRALVRQGTDASALADAGVEVVRGDIRDLASVERAVSGSRLVFHLARSHGSRADGSAAAVNVHGTAMLVSAAGKAGVARFVHAGSTTVYGFRPGSGVGEDAPLRPDTRYAWSKAMGERAVRSGAAGGMPVVIARITSVLGPGSRASAKLLRSVDTGRVRLIGGAEQRLHPADVDDIVDGLIRCGHTEAAADQTYNLAGPESVSVGQLMEMIAAALETPFAPSRFPALLFRAYLRLNRICAALGGFDLPRIASVGFLLSDRVFDLSKARAELGYAPRVGVAEAVRRTVDWYRRVGRAVTV